MTRRLPLAVAIPVLCLLACAPAGQAARPAPAEPPASRPAPALSAAQDALCAPLLLEPDYAFGTSVVLRRLPNAKDLDDLRFMDGLRSIVVALPEWPSDYSRLQPLQQAILPEGAELVVLLPGWPPTREALNAWNLVGGPLRVILVVEGPPTDRALIAELNRMRPLERVVAQMEYPSRSGFERLQRPLSFRVVRD